MPGHARSVVDVRFSADGASLMIVDSHAQVTVVDARTGRVRRTWRWRDPSGAARYRVTAVATGPGDRVAFGTGHGSVHVVRLGPDDAPPEACVLAGLAGVPTNEIAFLDDGERVATRHRDRVQVHDLGQGRVLADVTMQDSYGGRQAWWVLDGWLAVAEGDTVVARWILGEGPVVRMPGHTPPVTALDAVRGRWVSTDDDGVVRTWEMPTGRAVAAFVAAGRAAVDPVTGRLALPTATGGDRIVDPDRGDPPAQVARHVRQARRRRRAEDRLRALSSRLGRVPRWATALDEAADRRQPAEPRSVRAGSGLEWTVGVANEEQVDGNLVSHSHELTFGNGRGEVVDTVRLPGRCVAVLPLAAPDRLTSMSDNGALHVWTAAGELVSVLDVTDADVRLVVPNPAGTLVAVVSDDADGSQVRVVDPATEHRPDTGAGDRHLAALSVVADADGGWVATGMRDLSVVVRELADGSVRHTFPGHVTGRFRSSITVPLAHGVDRVGPWLARTDDDGTLRVHDPVDGTRICVARGRDGDLLTAAGADWVAVAEPDGSVRLRDPRTGTVRAELRGHRAPVRAAGTGGSLLVTSAADGVRLWDPATGAARGALPPSGSPFAYGHVYVDAHGQRFAVTDGTAVRVYDADAVRLAELLLPSALLEQVGAMDPSGTLLLVGDHRSGMSLCDLVTGRVDPLHGDGGASVTVAGVAPEGNLVAACYANGVVCVWEVHTRALVARIETGGAVTGCTWVGPTLLLTAGLTGLNLLRVGD